MSTFDFTCSDFAMVVFIRQGFCIHLYKNWFPTSKEADSNAFKSGLSDKKSFKAALFLAKLGHFSSDRQRRDSLCPKGQFYTSI